MNNVQEDKIFGMTRNEIIAAVDDRCDTVDSNDRISSGPLKQMVRDGVELLKKDRKYCESIRIKE